MNYKYWMGHHTWYFLKWGNFFLFCGGKLVAGHAPHRHCRRHTLALLWAFKPGAPALLSCLLLADVLTVFAKECLVTLCWQSCVNRWRQTCGLHFSCESAQLSQRRPSSGHCKPDFFLLVLHPNYFIYFFIESVIEIIVYSHGVVRNNTVHSPPPLPRVTFHKTIILSVLFLI